MMAAARRLVHFVHNPTRKGRVFRDRQNPLDLYDDLELFQRFRFPRLELLALIDEMADFSPTMSCTYSTYHGSSGGSPPPPSLGLRFSSNHFFFTLSTVRGTVPVAFRAAVMLPHTLAFFWFVTVLECFACRRVLFYANCDTSVRSSDSEKFPFLVCLTLAPSLSIMVSLPGVKENPRGFRVTAKYRRPYASTVLTDSILCIVAAIWRGCRNFEPRT